MNDNYKYSSFSDVGNNDYIQQLHFACKKLAA
jgi:hypothetical protein